MTFIPCSLTPNKYCAHHGVPRLSRTALIPFGSPKTFFVTFEMTGVAEGQSPGSFQVNHEGLADVAEDPVLDLPLVEQDAMEVGTGVIDTALSTATCQAPFDLNLENRTISTALVCQAGTVLRSGPGIEVTASGDLLYEAGEAIQLDSGNTFEAGADFEAAIDPGLLPP